MKPLRPGLRFGRHARIQARRPRGVSSRRRRVVVRLANSPVAQATGGRSISSIVARASHWSTQRSRASPLQCSGRRSQEVSMMPSLFLSSTFEVLLADRLCDACERFTTPQPCHDDGHRPSMPGVCKASPVIRALCQLLPPTRLCAASPPNAAFMNTTTTWLALRHRPCLR